jgi:hypothetical protein
MEHTRLSKMTVGQYQLLKRDRRRATRNGAEYLRSSSYKGYNLRGGK